ncbi:MAG: hypothetical protein V1839_02660 [archaeon]
MHSSENYQLITTINKNRRFENNRDRIYQKAQEDGYKRGEILKNKELILEEIKEGKHKDIAELNALIELKKAELNGLEAKCYEVRHQIMTWTEGRTFSQPPTNEGQVISLFFTYWTPVFQPKYGFEKVLELFPPGYPDATMLRNSQVYEVEFEFRSSDFENHGHYRKLSRERPTVCICWRNNKRLDGVEVIDLRNALLNFYSR